jgi:hypothetical protein
MTPGFGGKGPNHLLTTCHTIRQHHTYSTTCHAMNHAVISSACILILLLHPSFTLLTCVALRGRPFHPPRRSVTGSEPALGSQQRMLLSHRQVCKCRMTKCQIAHAALQPRPAVTDSRFSLIGQLTCACGGLWSTGGSIFDSLLHSLVFAWPSDR